MPPIGGEDLGRAVLELVTDPTKLRAGMAAAREETAATLTSANAALKNIGSKMTATGGQMTRGITLPVLGAGAAIVAVGSEFDHTLSQIVGLVGVSRDQINQWRPEIEKLAEATGIGPGELAKGLYFVASSGIAASKAMGVLTIAARASEAGMGDVSMLADVLTAAMNAYAKSDLTAAHAMDVLVRGIQVGKAEPADFAASLGTVAPVAAQLGVTIEDLVGTMAVLSRTNSNVSENATSLGQILNTLLKPTGQTTKALDAMGLSAADLRQELSQKGLLAVLKTLGEHIGTDDEAIAHIFPNIRALRGVLNLTGQDAASVSEAMAKVADSTGALDDAVTAVADDASVKMNKALARLQVELIVLSSDVLPLVVSMLAGVVSGVHDVVTWFTALPGPVKSTAVQALAFLAVMGPLLVILGSLVSATSTVLGAFGSLATFLTASLIPRMTALVFLIEAQAISAITKFATVLFATGIPALERLGLALLGVEIAAAPLLLVAGAIIAIGVAASGAAPSIDEVRSKLAELEADHGWGRNQALIDAVKRKLVELEAEQAKEAAANAALIDSLRKDWDNTGIPQAVGGVIGKIGTALASGKYAIKDGSIVLVSALATETARAGKKAVAAVTTSIADMARAIREGRKEIVDAMTSVVDDAYDPLILAAEISATKVDLAEQKKIISTKGSTKAQIADARLRVLELNKQLARQLAEQTQYGTDAERLSRLTGRAVSKELVDGLKSGDKARKLESQKAAADIASGIIALEKTIGKYGTRTGNAYIDALVQALEDGIADVKRAHQKVANQFRASSPPGPESALHDIDKWGARTGLAWIEPLVTAIASGRSMLRAALASFGQDLGASVPDLTALAARASRPSVGALGLAGIPGAAADRLAASGSPATSHDSHDTYHDTYVVTVKDKDDPFEIARQLGRVSRSRPLAPRAVGA